MLNLNFKQRLGDFKLDINTQINTNGITALFGLSGAGKTSLLNVIAGLSKPDVGQVIFNDKFFVNTENQKFIPAKKRNIGYVFQEPRLFPHLTVIQNLKFGMPRKMRPELDAIIALLDLSATLKRYPFSLSGGEKQRVAIGRALLSAPELLLMDEPLSSLDLPRKRELLPYLTNLARNVKVPIIYVSHSLDEVLRIANHLVLIENGQVTVNDELNTVWESGALRPWLEETQAERQEDSSLLHVQIIEQQPRYGVTALSLGDDLFWVDHINLPLYEKLRVRVFAKDIILSLQNPTGNSLGKGIYGTVVECLQDDGEVYIQIKIGEHKLWSKISEWTQRELGIRAGQWLFIQIKNVVIVE
ncbi:molybdenum ABC transporter ATP-binding protein ModC [Thorsellia kenyensis]|uniref:Molybdenum ABC transporter ATP-binding protein ModC n=1 Tax=Thorsellia kenyensis TaxID=1549888 RepID=A0ABV6C9B7_9GAMM